MIQFHSLNTIIDDILLEARNNNIAESDKLSRIQIEQWIIEYRSKLIKQDIDKGRKINPDYIQEIVNISITDKYDNGSDISNNGVWAGMTTIDIPTGIDFNFDTPIVSITDEFDNTIQLMSEKRAKAQQNRRYSSGELVAYKKNARLFFVGNKIVESINIRMIAENPMSEEFGLNSDSLYPIPVNMVPVLKELIMTKEINIVALSDTTNNASSDIEKVGLSSADYKKLSREIK